MTRTLMVLFAAAGLIALGSLSTPSTVSAGEDGKTTFNTYCTACHGESGQGDGPAAAALDPKPAAFGSPGFFDSRPDDHLRKVIKEGGPAVDKSPLMAPWGAVLSDAQIDAIIVHIKTFKK
jgi:mono/diheme cytochrome c family protein